MDGITKARELNERSSAHTRERQSERERREIDWLTEKLKSKHCRHCTQCQETKNRAREKERERDFFSRFSSMRRFHFQLFPFVWDSFRFKWMIVFNMHKSVNEYDKSIPKWCTLSKRRERKKNTKITTTMKTMANIYALEYVLCVCDEFHSY